VVTRGARIINIWQSDGAWGDFVMEETISVDHGSAQAYPPSEQ
jgi:hypothetical protein